jgi:hypothetical protein
MRVENPSIQPIMIGPHRICQTIVRCVPVSIDLVEWSEITDMFKVEILLGIAAVGRLV